MTNMSTREERKRMGFVADLEVTQRDTVRCKAVCMQFFILCLALTLAGSALAQDRSSSEGSSSASFTPPTPSESTSKTTGDYAVTQSIEFGGRDSMIHGNTNNYDTFEDLNSGVRLFDYTIDMRSIDHKGIFFDNLNFTNSGYGGDPNDISRLRIDKSNVYDFRAMFRRDHDYWNYNLLGNPLNPTSGPLPAASAGIYNSPQLLDLSRKMQDYDLTLFPQGHFRIRGGLSRNADTGPAATTIEGGTEPFLSQTVSEITNSYRVGLDYRGLPKTTLSYDELLTYTYINNSATDKSFGFQLANGQPVDIGIVSVGTTPCSAASITPPTVSSTCNGYTFYSQVNNPHSAFPVERFSFQSSYFKNFVTSGSVSYSESKNTVPGFAEQIAGWSSRTLAAGSTEGGPAWAHRVSTRVNWSGEYSVTEKLSLTDQFVYDDWRVPGEWATADTNVFDQANPAANSGMLRLPFLPTPANLSNFAALCPIPFTAAVCPQHNASSGPDITDEIAGQYLAQNRRNNVFEVKYDFTHRISAYLGYEFTARTIQDFSAVWDTTEIYLPGGAGGTPGLTQPGGTAAGNYYFAGRSDCKPLVTGALPSGCVLQTNGAIQEGSPTNLIGDAGNDTSRNTYDIHENAGVLGIAARPMDNLRLNADFLFGYNDNSFTRVSPRQVQSYRVHGHYTPKMWVSVDGSVDINENRDNVSSVNNIEHDRTYGASVTLSPNSNFWFDFGYNYVDAYTQTYICFVDNGSTIFTAANSPCTIAASVTNGVTLGTLSTYASRDNFAYADAMFKPIKRVTLGAGYNGSIVRGGTTFLNPLTPTGTLDFTYLKPFVSIAFDVYKGLTYKTAWNYYGYDTHGPGPENPAGLVPLPSQNFNGSNVTFSLRYLF